MDYIYIYNCGVTKDLLRQGFNIADIKPNPKNKQRTVFMFAETDELKKHLKQKHKIII